MIDVTIYTVGDYQDDVQHVAVGVHRRRRPVFWHTSCGLRLRRTLCPPLEASGIMDVVVNCSQCQKHLDIFLAPYRRALE